MGLSASAPGIRLQDVDSSTIGVPSFMFQASGRVLIWCHPPYGHRELAPLATLPFTV